MWQFIDNVVKAQLKPPTHTQLSKLRRHRRVRVEYRKYIAGAEVAAPVQLGETAGRDPEKKRHANLRGHQTKVPAEPTRTLLVTARPRSDVARRLSAVIDAYKAEFHQQSVGLITREVCAAF